MNSPTSRKDWKNGLSQRSGISAAGNGNGGTGTGGVASLKDIAKEQELPSASEEFSEELDSVLDMFG